jgi:geranylgeranyl pyrophosphate synthase
MGDERENVLGVKELAVLDLVGDDLKKVEQKMRSMGEGAYEPLAQAFLQLLGSGGKRLRPALALAAYNLLRWPAQAAESGLLGGEESDRVIALAAAVETLHNATLVHDDLIDNALVRRGSTTLNAVWDKGATVLAGDYLFARAAGFAAETGNIRVVELFADTLRIICEGELRQHFSSRQWEQPRDSYYVRIFAKTASLFASATRSGAILAGASQAEEEALYEYGRTLGMAFQIVDDILDYTGDEFAMGKPVGSDLRQGIVTLPFFYYLQAHPKPAQVISKLTGWSSSAYAADGGNAASVDEVVTQVRASEAISQALAEARDFAGQAKASLALFPGSPIRQALQELPEFVVSRHL